MSEKDKTPATVGPTTPSNSQKVTKRQRPRGGKKIREAPKALLAAMEAGSVAGIIEASAHPALSQPAPSVPAPAAEQVAPPAPAASPSAPIKLNTFGSTGVAAPAVGLAHQITIASLVPKLKLSDTEVESLAGYLPHVIAGFIQGRRLARGHGGL
ncbi:hypothetical protein N7449_008253 [Penicillium cf. viridicatum]|uniref:Uncharacterized protein n=1 Tax=Penicillium cf. viridicatum TaxID=2972119 RepID=A0A9W9JA41_9EURO|nr:hypothetical protein N7449_008253 [Penicillium cf. viridicatum]